MIIVNVSYVCYASILQENPNCSPWATHISTTFAEAHVINQGFSKASSRPFHWWQRIETIWRSLPFRFSSTFDENGHDVFPVP